MLAVAGWAIIHNRGSIERSCEVLNAAIVKSQQPPKTEPGMPAPNEILIRAILEKSPEAVVPYKQALKHSKPFLPKIDCKRVATDPGYRPYGVKP